MPRPRRGPRAASGSHHCVLIDSRADYDRGARRWAVLRRNSTPRKRAPTPPWAPARRPSRAPGRSRASSASARATTATLFYSTARGSAKSQMIIHRNGTLVANNGATNGLSLQPGSSLAILAALAASELRLQAALGAPRRRGDRRRPQFPKGPPPASAATLAAYPSNQPEATS